MACPFRVGKGPLKLKQLVHFACAQNQTRGLHSKTYLDLSGLHQCLIITDESQMAENVSCAAKQMVDYDSFLL